MRKYIYIIILAIAPAAATAQEITDNGNPAMTTATTAQPTASTTTADSPTAQQPTLKYAYISYDKALKAMPGYETAQQNITSLKAQYEAEANRSEEEFNEKYEEFLDVQNELDGPILRKRQAELQELIDKGISFKAEAARLLKQAEADIYAPLRSELDALLRKLGTERGYAFIINTDSNALSFANTLYGEDITELVIRLIHNS